jgi:hypothetical protein
VLSHSEEENAQTGAAESNESEVGPKRTNAMSEQELKYPNWQVLLQEAILEFDRDKLVGRIQKVETVVFERLQELSSDSDHHGERQAIANALSTMRVLKKDKLFYPDWNG